MEIKNYIHIDFTRGKDIVVPSIQYDSGTRWVMAKLYDNGLPIDLQELKVCIVAVKSDGKEIFNECKIIDAEKGIIEFEITKQMGMIVGEVECQIKLFGPNKLLSSNIFRLSVTKTLSPSSESSQDQLETLVNALGEVQDIDNRFAQTNAQLSQNKKELLDNLTSEVNKIENHTFGYVNVKSFGAKGDGVTDDTDSIQNAIEYANINNLSVFIPSGLYLVGTIRLRKSVALKGDFSNDNSTFKGTVLCCVGEEEPGIKVVGYNHISNITFYYPNQKWDGVNHKPKKYPATIELMDNAHNVKLENLYFVNSYVGINATNRHECLTVQGVHGYCIYVGIDVDVCTDADRYTDLHFNYNAMKYLDIDHKEDYGHWTRRNGTAFKIKRMDWGNIDNSFCWGYYKGFHFLASDKDGRTPLGVRVVNSGADACGYCVYAETGNNIIISKCFFTSFNHFSTNRYDSTPASAFVIDSGYSFEVEGCHFWDCVKGCISNNGAKRVLLSSNIFSSYGTCGVETSNDYRAINCSYGLIVINNNMFRADKRDRVYGILINGTNLWGASIIGNCFEAYSKTLVQTINGVKNLTCESNVYHDCIGGLFPNS